MIRLIGIIILCCGFWSCDDEIPYELVVPEPGQQKVLVEEISGVRCPNCPDGSRLLEALNADFDGNLIVVTYHAGSFSIPYKDSKYDFKTDQTVELMEMLGRPIGYPAAAIQRIPVEGQDGFQRFSNTWTTIISEVLSSTPVVDLTLAVDTVGTRHQLVISALFLEAMDHPVYLTVYLTEDGLVDPQADTQAGEEYVEDFVHNHVLRRILTPVTGRKWADRSDAFLLMEDSLQVDFHEMPEIVDPGKTAFVVFVHTNDQVLQVEKAKAFP